MVVKLIGADIEYMRSSTSIAGDKDGKVKRSIEICRQEIKNHYRKFHNLIF